MDGIVRDLFKNDRKLKKFVSVLFKYMNIKGNRKFHQYEIHREYSMYEELCRITFTKENEVISIEPNGFYINDSILIDMESDDFSSFFNGYIREMKIDQLID